MQVLIENWLCSHPSGHVHLVGYSVGGWLAAVLAARCPDLLTSILLVAPAVDNYERNFQNVEPSQWYMPKEYVDDLKSIPARPMINTSEVLTTIVHAESDTDTGGGDPERIKEWVSTLQASATHTAKLYIVPGTHDMKLWLEQDMHQHNFVDAISSTFTTLIHRLLCSTAIDSGVETTEPSKSIFSVGEAQDRSRLRVGIICGRNDDDIKAPGLPEKYWVPDNDEKVCSDIALGHYISTHYPEVDCDLIDPLAGDLTAERLESNAINLLLGYDYVSAHIDEVDNNGHFESAGSEWGTPGHGK